MVMASRMRRTATIQPDEQGTAGPVQMHPAWRALLQDIGLMPKDQDFSFKLPAGLEAVAQHADEKKGIAIIDRDHVLIRSGPLPRWSFRKRQDESTACYAVDLKDAVNAAVAMARKREL